MILRLVLSTVALLSVTPVPPVLAQTAAKADTLRLGVDDAVRYAMRDGLEAAMTRLTWTPRAITTETFM